MNFLEVVCSMNGHWRRRRHRQTQTHYMPRMRSVVEQGWFDSLFDSRVPCRQTHL